MKIVLSSQPFSVFSAWINNKPSDENWSDIYWMPLEDWRMVILHFHSLHQTPTGYHSLYVKNKILNLHIHHKTTFVSSKHHRRGKQFHIVGREWSSSPESRLRLNTRILIRGRAFIWHFHLSEASTCEESVSWASVPSVHVPGSG